MKLEKLTARPQYQINIESYDGPLDLLLNLIERSELDITEISLVQVTSQYLSQIEQMKEDRIDNLIDFIVVGARLTQIKSKALLPQDPILVDPDGEAEEDPAAALIRQLKQYKTFKDASHWLGEREEAGLRSYIRLAPPPRIEKKLDLSGVSLDSLWEAFLLVNQRQEKKEASVAIVKPRRITIEDQIRKLRFHMQRAERIGFRQLLSNQVDRTEISITLLAILESIKRHEVNAIQPELFGPIEIARAKPLPPE